MRDLEHWIQEANDVILNNGETDRVPEFFAESYVVHANGDEASGREFIGDFVTRLRDAFPDLRVEVEVLMTEGEKIAWVRTVRGTHQSEFAGLPGTGREVVWHDMIVTRFEGGRIAEEWGVSGLGAQLYAQE